MNKIRGFEVISKYKNEKNIIMPTRATKYSACYDLYNNTGSEIFVCKHSVSEAISTKLKAYMQNDEALMIYIRSKYGFKYSTVLTNSTGIIDSDYYNNKNNEGEIFIKLYNYSNNDLVIEPNIAIAQGMFIKYLLTDNDSINFGNSRNGGFGSTDK